MTIVPHGSLGITITITITILAVTIVPHGTKNAIGLISVKLGRLDKISDEYDGIIILFII